MEIDLKYQKLLWQTLIPVEIHLAKNEITTLDTPTPYYCLLSRQNYLPCQLNNIRNHFLQYIPTVTSKNEIWFEIEQDKLRWQIPIGVLLDIYNIKKRIIKIIVHFQQFPIKELLRCSNEETIKNFYINSLKESSYLQCGHSNIIMSLTINEISQLWNNIKLCNFQSYNEIYQKIQLEINQIEQEGYYYPIRILFYGINNNDDKKQQDQKEQEKKQEKEKGEDIQQQQQARQEQQQPYDFQIYQKPYKKQGENDTLLMYLKHILSTTTYDDIFDINTNELKDEIKVIIQGIEPSLHMTLNYLCQFLHYADGFLYIVILNTKYAEKKD